MSFADVVQSPSPRLRPSPPIVVGGHAPASFRRAARVGDGWFGWDLGVDEAAAAIASLRQQCEAVGRAADELEVTIAPPAEPDADDVARYAEVGVDRLVLQPEVFTGSAIDELIDRFGRG